MATALTIEAVSKEFRVRRNRPTTLREGFVQWLSGRHGATDTVVALRDVSFSVARGESLGIVGHNGAGKSTLLRLLCGVGLPTSGRITRNGHVSGLLELGGSFHLDLSGHDNVVTAAVLAGMTEREAHGCVPQIAAFAELEDVIEHPVRTYSSGMYLRLAFAVAVRLDPEVLVIDEVLAVGDVRFQQNALIAPEADERADQLGREQVTRHRPGAECPMGRRTRPVAHRTVCTERRQNHRATTRRNLPRCAGSVRYDFATNAMKPRPHVHIWRRRSS